MSIEKKAVLLLNSMAGSSVEKVLDMEPTRSIEIIVKAPGEVTEAFVSVARDSTGSQRLYDEILQTSETPVAQRLLNEKDHVAVMGKASAQLKSIVGDVTHQRMQKKLTESLNLSGAEADNSLALGSLSVLEVLKEELKSGVVENSSAGVTNLLIPGSEKVSPVVAGSSPASIAGETTVTSPGNDAVAAAGSASLLRFAPHALLGILALGTAKYCSDANKHRGVEEERVSLQQELSAARVDAEAKTSNIQSLQGEFDSAQLQIQSLQSDLDSTQSKLQVATAELAAERDVPNDTAELQTLLSDVTSDRNAAVDSKQALTRQLEIVNRKYEDATVEVESTKAELEAARSIISANKNSADQIRQLKENVSEINQKHDAAIQLNAGIVEENKSLRATIDDTAKTVADLESQVLGLQTSNKALQQEKTLKLEEISQLTSSVDELEQRHESVAPNINKLESRITSQLEEIATLEAELQLRSNELEEEKAAQQAISTRLTAKNTDVQNQLSQMMLLKNTAESKFGQEQSKVSEQAETISDLEGQVDVLELANEELKVSTVALQKNIDELDGRLSEAEEQVSASDFKLTEKDDALAAVNDELASARHEITELKSQSGESSVLNNELQTKVDLLTEENNDLLDGAKVLNDQIAALSGELETGKQRAVEAEQSVAMLEKSLDTERESLTQISNERDQLKDALAIAKADIDSLSSEKSAAMEKIDALNRKASELNEMVDAGKSTISDLEQGNSEIEQENIALQQAADDSRERIVILGTRLNSVASELNRERESAELMAAKNSELEEQLLGATQARDTAQDDLKTLQQSLSTADQKIAEMTAKQQALISEVDSANAYEKEAVSETLALRGSIEQQLADASLQSVTVQSIEDDRAVAITLGSKSLYQAGDASLTREGGQTLNKIGKILEKHPDWRVDIEGHTDSLPIGDKLRQRYPSNWELSSARASAVVTFLRLTTNVKADSLSAKGYAETKPIADNGSVKGREQNRRVDIVLRK